MPHRAQPARRPPEGRTSPPPRRYAAPRRHASSLLLALIGAGPALAADPVVPPLPPIDAGRVLEGLRAPAAPERNAAPMRIDDRFDTSPSPDDAEPIDVTALRWTGDALPATIDLPSMLPTLPRRMTLGELKALAGRVTRALRDEGYLLARAYLPAQEIRDGVVAIGVMKGRLGRASVENRSATDAAVFERLLAPLAEGDAIRDDALERAMLLLREQPGTSVDAVLRPGTAVGTTDLVLTVQDTERVWGSAGVDGHGSRYTGAARANVNLQVASLLGLGDLASVQASVAGGMQYGRLAWAAPLGSQGLRLGVAMSGVGYRLGGRYAALDASGTARVVGVTLVLPIVRRTGASLDLQANLDHKRLDDVVRASDVVTAKRLRTGTVTLSGSINDDDATGGVTSGSLGLGYSHLALDAASLATDQGAGGYGTAGGSARGLLSLSHRQRLAAAWSVQLTFNAQVAARNLSSSDKMSLGGAQGVRAYPSGEAAGDDAWLGTAEVHYAGFGAQGLRLFGFYDRGRSWASHEPLPTDVNVMRTLHGGGVGAHWYPTDRLRVTGSVAWRGTEAARSEPDRPWRAWVEVSQSF